MTPAKKTRQAEKLDKDRIAASFAACPRCSYFLSGYRLLHDDFETAAGQSDSLWLNLTWDHSVRLLVQKSFGSRIFMELDTFEGICPECRRPYSYQRAVSTDEAPIFTVKIVP